MATGPKSWLKNLEPLMDRAKLSKPWRFETQDDKLAALAIAVSTVVIGTSLYLLFFPDSRIQSSSEFASSKLNSSQRSNDDSPKAKKDAGSSLTFKREDGSKISAEELLGYPPPKKPKYPEVIPLAGPENTLENQEIKASNERNLQVYQKQIEIWKEESFEYQKNAYQKYALASQKTVSDPEMNKYLSSQATVRKKQMERIWSHGRPIEKNRFLELLRTFKVACGDYPPTKDGLKIIWGLKETNCKTWNIHFVVREIENSPRDKAWKLFSYKKTSTGFKLSSLGADQKRGGEGLNKDIVWTEKSNANTLAVFEREQQVRFSNPSEFAQNKLLKGIQERKKNRLIASNSSISSLLSKNSSGNYSYDVDLLREHYKALLASDIRPGRLRGKQLSFVLYAVSKGSFFDQLGLKKNDQITKFNNKSFSTKEDFKQVYTSIMQTRPFNLTIKSDGELRTIRLSPF